MLFTGFLTCALLSSVVQGSIIRRWPDSKQPAGLVDDGVTKSCSSWLNYIAPGEKCDVLLGKVGITEKTFLTLNPILGQKCNRLEPGHSYCISVDISVGDAPVPSPTRIIPRSATPTITERPKTVQGGLISACNGYHKVEQGDNCYTVSQKYGISLDNLYAWNPSVGAGCENLWLGYHVCLRVEPIATSTTTQTPPPTVEVPSPSQTGITKSCTDFYTAERGDTCYSIANKYKTFTPEQFIGWNPSVGAGCTNIYVGYHYCVAIVKNTTPPSTSSPAAPSPTRHVPAPVHPGTIASCKKYHLVSQWDTCLSIGETYGISHVEFHKWNPSVGYDCKNLWAGYRVCVQV